MDVRTQSPRSPESRRILVACALEREARWIRKRLEPDVPVAVTGLGSSATRRTLRRLLALQTPACLLFTGIAGQLNPQLDLGDLVLPSQWMTTDRRIWRLDDHLQEYLTERQWSFTPAGLTVSRPLLSRRERMAKWQSFGADACDMESAAVMEVAQELSLPALSFKIISDVSGSSVRDFWRQLDGNLDKLACHVARLFCDLKTFRLT